MSGYHIENFGCRASRADGDAIAAQLETMGASPDDNLLKADIVVVNTCTVTAEADRDARAYIRRVRRANPRARIVVTGCYAQRAPQEIADLPGVYAVVGNSHKGQVATIALNGPTEIVEMDRNEAGNGLIPISSIHTTGAADSAAPATPAFLISDDIFAHTDFQLPSLPASVIERLARSGSAHRTRPSLKIQDGCGNRCTFCIIPATRGNSRSLPRRQVLTAVQEFVAAGGRELVISGINLGRWGRDLVPQECFEDLLSEILDTTQLSRLRISSVEPMDWTDGLISLLGSYGKGLHPRLARHAHLPLQSGSDAVLRRMHRRYRPWHYADRLAKIRTICPDAAIGADVMVGFPGESDREFQENYDFITAQPFTYLHLFPFSARPGTPGWELHRQVPVPGGVVRERMAALRELIDRKNLDFRSAYIGKKLSAITLNTRHDPPPHPQAVPKTLTSPLHTGGTAMTDNFLPLELEENLEPNLLVTVQIIRTTPRGLVGIVQKEIRPPV